MSISTLPKARSELERYLGRGQPPCDYERQLLRTQAPSLKAILAGKHPPPYELEIQPSSLCNLDCTSCFGRDNALLPNRMGKEEMRTIAGQVEDFVEDGFGVDIVKFCGITGEPLVNPAIAEGIELFKAQKKKLIVFTNGLNLDRRVGRATYADHLLEVDKLNVSLDAGSEEIFIRLKGRPGYHRILTSLSDLVRRRGGGRTPYVVVSYVIGTKNYQDIVSAAQVSRDVGADEIRYRVDFTDPGGVKGLAGIVSKKMDDARLYAGKAFTVTDVYSEDTVKEGAFNSDGYRCFNQRLWASIGPDCELYACGHRTLAEVRSYGSLLARPLAQLWKDPVRWEPADALPDAHCKYCSPSSVRRNAFLSWLACLPDPVGLIDDYLKEGLDPHRSANSTHVR